MKRSVRRLGVGVLGVLMLTVSVLSFSAPAAAQIGIGISVRIGPPALPVYAQPLVRVRVSLEPGYWGMDDGAVLLGSRHVVVGRSACCGRRATGASQADFMAGTEGMGTHVGFYGGINYALDMGRRLRCGEWRAAHSSTTAR